MVGILFLENFTKSWLLAFKMLIFRPFQIPSIPKKCKFDEKKGYGNIGLCGFNWGYWVVLGPGPMQAHTHALSSRSLPFTIPPYCVIMARKMSVSPSTSSGSKSKELTQQPCRDYMYCMSKKSCSFYEYTSKKILKLFKTFIYNQRPQPFRCMLFIEFNKDFQQF